MSNRAGLAVALVAVLVVAARDGNRVGARQAEPAPRDATTILLDSDRAHRPKTEQYLGDVTVISRDGKERHKEWMSYRQGPADAADRLIRFLKPPETQGVGYLARHHPGKNPDEWLYLPSMKRERRIGARDRDAAFVGTGFSYEDLDLVDFDVTRYDAELLPSETVSGVPVDVIALTPRTPSAYSKRVLRLRQDNLNLLTVDFFAAGSSTPVKRLTLADYAPVGDYLIASRLEMDDLRKGTRTIVLVQDVVVDRPQPADRYTIENLLRDSEPRPPASPGARGDASEMKAVGAPTLSSGVGAMRAPGDVSGYVEAKGFGFFDENPAHGPTPWQWVTALVRDTGHIGSATISGSLRLEESASTEVGPLVFDPADRRGLQSPVSIRTLSVVIPLRSGVDLQVGRFDIGWGETDGYSPEDAFLPRDLSDPLNEERLPLWGADLRGERHGVRFEVLAVPVTTPWRLPTLTAPDIAFPTASVSVVEEPWTVPKAGFGAVRVKGTIRGWDLGGWARGGVRPVPVLDPELQPLTGSTSDLVVLVTRHFAHETAVGGSASREVGGWIVQSELGVFRSPDPQVGNATIWSIGGSRLVGNGGFTATVAGNAMRPPVNPLLLLDRALLPVVIVAFHELTPWGSWHTAWLGTFHTVGGVLTAEATKDLGGGLDLTAGADLPHGAELSPATVFAGGKRVRAALRWNW